MDKAYHKKSKQVISAKKAHELSINGNSDFAGGYVCSACGYEVSFVNGTKEKFVQNPNFRGHPNNSHALDCPYNHYSDYNNNKSAMTFTIGHVHQNFNEKVKIETKNYANDDFSEVKKSNSTAINNFFNLSESIYQKAVEKIEKSNFKIKDLTSKKTYKLNDYFIKVDQDIKQYLNLDESRIFYGKVVIFEDVYHNNPVYRLSFHHLQYSDFQLKCKVYSNTQNKCLKRLHGQLTQIPSKYKKRVNNNTGSYTLGRAVFIRANIIEKDGHLYFKSIRNLWLCDADNKYNNQYDITENN